MIVANTAIEAAQHAEDDMEIWRDGDDGPYVAVLSEDHLPQEDGVPGWFFVGYAHTIKEQGW